MHDGTPDESSAAGFGVESLADEIALWRLGHGADAKGLIECACAALVAGVDSPSLRELAGLPYDADYWDTTAIAERTFEELFGIPIPAPGDELWGSALAAMARRHLAGALDARDLANWAHAAIGHRGIAAAQSLVELDDHYDIEFGGVGPRGRRPSGLDARVTQAARTIVDTHAHAGWPPKR